LFEIGIQTQSNLALGRMLVAISHRTQCAKKTSGFQGSRLSVGRSYAVKGSKKKLSCFAT
jgi:hypothetical protein